MMGAACRRNLLATSLIVLAVSACSGRGSDIGPRLPRLPDESSKVVLLDDQNRGVVSGRVTVSGTSVQALTGRNGRGDFLASPRERLVFEVNGAVGSASAGDRLAELNVALTMQGLDLPTPIHLPDLPDASSSLVASGVQGGTTVLTSTSMDSIVTVGGAVSVAHEASPAPVTLRIGELSPQHLPGRLPLGGSSTVLYGHGVFVHPATATFSPGLDIDMLDDLTLDGNVANLYRLDPDTGEWAVVSTATATGGRIILAGVLTTGGLYAFGVAVNGVAVSGRVVRMVAGQVDPVPVPDAMVRVDQRHTRTLADGTFLVDFVAATLGDGTAPRSAVIEVFAGGSWLPVVATASVAIAGDPTDAGDILLDTEPAGNLRVQQVLRARADPFQPARFSSLTGGVALATTSDAAGQLMFEDVPASFFGFLEGRPISGSELFYGQVIGFLEPGRRWSEANQFLARRPWFLGTRSARAFACDSIGGGPIFGAAIMRGTGLDGLVVITNENGFGFTDREFFGRATASVRTTRGGQSITHARSVVAPNADQIELPLRRVLRDSVGMFDRHGLVAGTLTGTQPGAQFGLRVSRRITRQEWWDDIVEGVPLQSSLPIDIDPATSGDGTFQAGIDAAGGHLAAVETVNLGGGLTLQRLGLLADFTPTEGAVIARDVALDALADTPFSIVDAAASADPLVDLNTLDLALGFELANGQLVDVARGLAGSLATSGSDLRLTLPALTGSLDGGQWLALVSGSASDVASTVSHASWIPLATTATEGFEFPSFPTLLSPAPPLLASGFNVDFSLPADAIAGMVELRSETANDLLLWQAFVPPDATEFLFSQLPAGVETPLVAGRTYKLTVTAFFGPANVVAPRGYAELSSFAQSVGVIETGVTRISRRSIVVNT